MKKSKLKKKADKHTESWYRKKCVEHAKKEAKKRDNYICQRCGKDGKKGFKIDGSHIKSEGTHKSMSADVDNIMAKCVQCHMWWHENPTDASNWFKEKYPELNKELDKRAQKPFKVYWKQRYEELKELYNDK